MKLIEQKVENISQNDFSYEGAMKFAERVGRICYNSTDKITKDSWEYFNKRLIRNKHYSVFGHATIHIKTPLYSDVYQLLKDECYAPNGSGLRMEYRVKEGFSYWTMSMRVFVEKFNKKQQKRIMQYIDETPSEFYTKRYSVIINTAISVTRELNRHEWDLDVMEKSTRYTECFDVIKPYWYNDAKWINRFIYKNCCRIAFACNKLLLKNGLKKQEARGVLPLDTATQVIYTAFDHQWQDVFAKRLVGGAHPDCKRLVKLIKESE